jgi:TonB family protein
MANAIITQNGTQNTVHTDANGYFKIAAPVKSELIVNSMGYVPKLVKVNDNNKLKITLSDSLKTLAEVQIRGNATLKKTEATGAVSTIQAKDLEELQATTIDQALQGRLPGVAIVSAGKDPKATKTITGRVIAKDDHQPLPGVSIMVKGSSTGTVTDINGKFKLTLPPKADALVLAYIGYERKEVKVPSKNDADIELASSSRSLSEVVVTRSPGYSQDQEENTEARPYAGWDDFNKYIKDNATAIDGKKGVVRLAFTVNPDGSLSDITVKKGISPAVDQKAINLLKNGPQWRGNKNGKPETVRLRVRFK